MRQLTRKITHQTARLFLCGFAGGAGLLWSVGAPAQESLLPSSKSAAQASSNDPRAAAAYGRALR
ncbi:MAG: hypothetical protein ABI461_18895, partial [Polyangiaceae bacterium]